MIRLHRHRLGPRVYVLSRRIHEWHAGVAVIAIVAAGRIAGAWPLSLLTVLVAMAGTWLVLKDWQDLIPSKRDTASWRLGLHRRAAPLRAIRRAEGLPALAGSVAFAVGLVNLASAVTPNIAWRHHLLLRLEPVELVPILHTLAVPASVMLVVSAFYLRARRHRAWQAALVLMLALGVLELLKGLDFEEALLSWTAAALLWWGRDSFYVRHERLRPLSPVLLGLVAVAVACGSMLAWAGGLVELEDELGWVPLAGGGLGLAAIVALTWILFRPLAPPRLLPGPDARRDAFDLVRAHGSDTLAFFKLRRDAHYHFTDDRSAFLGYRVANNVMLISGDPVGPSEALPQLVRDACAFAEIRGLHVAALGASESLLPIYRQAGLRALYIGDEAIVDTRSFSLEGRSIRKVRQSVSRLEAAGYSVEASGVDQLDEDTLSELDRVSELWRQGAPERGFTRAMDSLHGGHHVGSVIVAARDEAGAIRGFIHFVPSYGRAAMSLSFMRRDRETPNGLMEFLVVRAIELLRERGVEELSLNFAAFGRWLGRPEGRSERALGRLIALGNRFFQIESLYRFNAKFEPRWAPRYLVYEGVLALPRVAGAALRIEGQLPKLRP
jgi:lysyl-tRNA synthetase, class II